MQDIADFRAESESYAATMSRAEKDIAKAIGLTKMERQKELSLAFRDYEVRQRTSEVIDKTIEMQKDLVADMSRQFSLSKNSLPYAKQIATIESYLHAINTKTSGLREKQAKEIKQVYTLSLATLKTLQQERIQFEAIANLEHNIEDTLGLEDDQLAKIGGKLKAMLVNPWTAVVALIGMAVVKWKDIEESAENFRYNTGLTVGQMEKLDTYIRDVAEVLRDEGVYYEEAYKAAGELYDVFGNISIVTKDNVKLVADLTARLGVSERNGANFAKNMWLVGRDAEKMRKEFESVAAETGTSVATLMDDMAQSAEDSYGFMSKHPEEFIRTTAKARALGMSMRDVVKITGGLLNIEESLNAEMEAQILSGHALNLDAARYYTLMGDQGKALNAILSQLTTLEDFSKMNVLAQQAYADAVGMTVEGLASVIKAHKEEQMLSAAERQRRKEIDEQQKTVQSNLTKLTNSFRSLASDLSTLFLPAIELLAKALKPITTGFSWIHKQVSELPGYLREAVQWIGAIGVIVAALAAKKGIGTLGDIATDWIGSKLGGARTRGVAEKVLRNRERIFGRGGPKGLPGKRTLDDLKGLGTAFDKQKVGNLLAGSVAMIAMAGSIWIIVDALKGMQNVKWENVAQVIGIMGALTAAVWGLGKAMQSPKVGGAILAGSAAIAVMGGAVWIVADAMEKVAKSSDSLIRLLYAMATVDKDKIAGLGAALSAVGFGLSTIGVGEGIAGVMGAIFGVGKPATEGKEDQMSTLIQEVKNVKASIDRKDVTVRLDGYLVSKYLGVVTERGVQ